MNPFANRDHSTRVSDELVGCGVWVTKPAEQAEGLCEAIEIYGGTVLRLPTLLIEPLVLESFEVKADFLIFTSQQAVLCAPQWLWPLIKALGVQTKILAMGASTAILLEEQGLEVDFYPLGLGTESLLEAPLLQDLKGRMVHLVTGEGGRACLAEVLSARGAQVTLSLCYRRAPLAQPIDWRPWVDRCQSMIATSVDAFMLARERLEAAGQAWLQSLWVIAGSPRIAAAIKEVDPLQRVITARSMYDADLVQALIKHRMQIRGEVV